MCCQPYRAGAVKAMQAGDGSECRLSSSQCQLAGLVASGGCWLARVVTPRAAEAGMDARARALAANATQPAEQVAAQARLEQVALEHNRRRDIGALDQHTWLLRVIDAPRVQLVRALHNRSSM